MNEDAVGVAFCKLNNDGTYGCPPFVIHPSEGANLKYSNEKRIYYSVTATGSYSEAIKDFNGENNTKYIIQDDGSSVTGTGPAYAYGLTFKHGKKGYVPAAGELYYMFWTSQSNPYYQKINECLTIINGVPLDNKKDYWSSTSTDEKMGAWECTSGDIGRSGNKTAQKYVRAIAKL